MFKVLVPAVAALALVAFAAQSRTSVPQVQATMTTPAMGWSVHHEGALAKLAYGVANSDQLALMVTCVAGDDMAVVYGDVEVEGARLMPTDLHIDPLSGGDAGEMRIPIDAPSLTGLAQRGRLTVIGGAGRFRVTTTNEERRLVRDFLAYCSSGRV